MICRCNYDMLSALFLCAYIFLMNSLTYMSWVKVFYCYLATIICCLQQLMMDKYQWNHCEFSFSNKSYLLVHLYTRSDDRTYHYTYVKEIYFFHMRKSPGRHVRTHNEENPYKCRHCEKSFTVKSHLKVHIIPHITENNYQCTYCDKPF